MKTFPVLTPEEAKAIRWVLKQTQYKDHPSVFIEEHMRNNMDGWLGEAKALNGLHIDALIRALYIGYEIERPKYEIGDIVVGLITGFIYKLTHTYGENFYATKLSNGEKSLYVDVDAIRHATEEEKFWAELGRDYRKFKWDDCLVLRDGETFRVLSDRCEVYAEAHFENGSVSSFYPADSRIKFPN